MISEKGLLEGAKILTKMSNLYSLSLGFDYSSLINSYHRSRKISEEGLLKLGNDLSKMESLYFVNIDVEL